MRGKVSVYILLWCCLITTKAAHAFADAGSTEHGSMTQSQCRAVVQELFTSLLARDWELLQPADVRVQAKKEQDGVLAVEAKTLPYAYLNCTPALCLHPRRFVTPAVRHLFQRMPYEHVLDVKCPERNASCSALNAFRMRATFAFSELYRYLELHKQTSQIRTFFPHFHTLFKAQWVAQQQELAQGAEILLWDADAFEQFTDHQYKRLTITLYFYAAVWDGGGATHESSQEELASGLRNTPVTFPFTIDVSSKRGSKKEEKELKDRADEAVRYMLDIAKAIFLHGPVKPL